MSETICIKTKFATEKDAVFYIDKLKKTSTREKVPIRTYKCWCGAWHLSSKKSFSEMSQDITKLEKEIEQLKSDLKTAKQRERDWIKAFGDFCEAINNQNKKAWARRKEGAL